MTILKQEIIQKALHNLKKLKNENQEWEILKISNVISAINKIRNSYNISEYINDLSKKIASNFNQEDIEQLFPKEYKQEQSVESFIQQLLKNTISSGSERGVADKFIRKFTDSNDDKIKLLIDSMINVVELQSLDTTISTLERECINDPQNKQDNSMEKKISYLDIIEDKITSYDTKMYTDLIENIKNLHIKYQADAKKSKFPLNKHRKNTIKHVDKQANLIAQDKDLSSKEKVILLIGLLEKNKQGVAHNEANKNFCPKFLHIIKPRGVD